MFNRLPKAIRMLCSCSVVGFKSNLDSYLRNIVDLPCRPGLNNSLDGGDCLHGGHYADDLATNYISSVYMQYQIVLNITFWPEIN